MKFDYPFAREEYLKFLKLENRKSNVICMLLFTIVYFIAIFDLLKDNLLSVFVFYLVSIAILYSVLKVISALFAHLLVKRNDKVLEYSYGTYHISIDKTSIQEEIKDKKFEIKFANIARIKVHKNYFVVEPKENGIIYIFMKNNFKTEEKYNECKEMILENYKKAKTGNVEEEPIQEEKKKEATLSKEKETEKRIELEKKKTTANTQKK